MASIVEITNPITGIPEKVDKLDHTAQEIDDAVSRALPSGSIDASIQKKPNPNLLDDSYFVNPVDQRGGYVVPPGKQYYKWGEQTPSGTLADYATVIGYKGPTSDDSNYYPVVSINETEYVIYDPGNVNPAVRGYTGAGYGIDRWKSYSNLTVLIEPDGITIRNDTDDAGYFGQTAEYDLWDALVGKTVTMSALTGNGTLYFCTGTYGTNINFPVGDGVNAYMWPTSKEPFDFSIAAGASIKVYAVKLELGSQQTLAHQDENGVWVLNEIPNYAEELAKCQRYQLVIGQAGKYAPIGIGQARTSTIVSVIVPTPVSLRALPTVRFIAPVFLRNKDAFATIDYSNSRVDIYGPGTVMLKMACTSAIAGAAYDMSCAPGGKIILDANL